MSSLHVSPSGTAAYHTEPGHWNGQLSGCSLSPQQRLMWGGRNIWGNHSGHPRIRRFSPLRFESPSSGFMPGPQDGTDRKASQPLSPSLPYRAAPLALQRSREVCHLLKHRFHLPTSPTASGPAIRTVRLEERGHGILLSVRWGRAYQHYNCSIT